MKVFVFKFDYDTMIVSFGNYYEYDDHLACAASKTNISVTHLEVEYNRQYKSFTLYPKGTIECGCCKQDKSISINKPAYAMNFRNKRYGKMVYKSLVCSDCKQRIGKYAFMAYIGVTKLCTFGGSPEISRQAAKSSSSEFIMRCIVRRWKRNARISCKKKEAIAKLKPYILHWATKPDGPLYHMAIKRLNITL